MSKGLYIAMLLIVLCGMIAGIVIIIKDKKKGKPVNKKLVDVKKKHQVVKRYNFFYNNVLTRKTFRKIVTQLSDLSVYEMLELKSVAVKQYTKILIVSVGGFIGGVILLQELTAILFLYLFIVVFKDTVITRYVDNVHFQVVCELSDAIGSVDMQYMRTGGIVEAIESCSRGPHIARAFDKIQAILTAVNSEELLEEFYHTVPFHQLQTFAGVCYLLNMSGDEEDERGGSAFQTSLALLKNELDSEIRHLTRMRMWFKFLRYAPLVPLVAMGPLKWFFTSQIPGTSAIYNGLLGYTAQTLSLLSSIIVYKYVASICSIVPLAVDDRNEVMLKLSKNKLVAPIVSSLIPKSPKTKNKFTRLLKGAISQKTLQYIYTSKVFYSVSVSLATLLLLVVFTFTARDWTYASITPVSFSGTGNMTVETAEKLRALDKEMMARPSPPRSRDLELIMLDRFTELSPMDQGDQIERIVKKYTTYHNLYFHWWYVLLALGAGVGCWFVPEAIIDARKKLVKAEAESDVMQMQTILSILIYTNLDTLDVLWWLGKQSRIHKDAIMFAYHEYPSDPEKSLNRLKDKSTIPAFNQIVESLLSTVSHRSLKEAFHTLIDQRNHMLSIKEMVQSELMENRRSKASMYSKIPLYIVLIGYAAMPIGVLGISELMRLFSQL